MMVFIKYVMNIYRVSTDDAFRAQMQKVMAASDQTRRN